MRARGGRRRRWFNGVQLAAIIGSVLLCYAHFKNKRDSAMDALGWTHDLAAPSAANLV